VLNWRLKIVLKSLPIFVVVAFVAGIVYEQAGRRRDRARFPQIGRSVDIGGRSLNIFCSGAGTPPVIFESGGPAPASNGSRFNRKSPSSHRPAGTTEPARVGAIPVPSREPATQLLRIFMSS
jgi:hypothetical protein